MVKHGPLKFEYDQITPYIYIGTNMCCEGHFEKELIKKGIKADIALESEKIDAPFGVEYFLWLPTLNHRAPSKKQMLIGVQMMHEFVKRKIKCYVHCQRGHGRAPTLVAAYFVSKGMSIDEAVKKIKNKRPVAHPNKVQRSAVSRLRKQLLKLA